MTDIDKAIEAAVRIPAVLVNVINTTNSDLYHGPIYIDADGDHVSCFDQYHHQFDFPRAIGIISNWLDNQPTGYLDTQSGEIGKEPEFMECDDCDSTGINIANDIETICDTCDGQGAFEPEWTDFYEVNRNTLAVALLGRELARHM